MGDLIERLEAISKHHKGKIDYWTSRNSVWRAQIHADIVAALEETISRLRAIPEDKS